MAKVVSIDVPSGLCADSGRDLGRHAILSDLTVTFQYLKVGQLVGDGPALCSRVVVKDIGIEPRRMAHLNASGQSGWILYPPGAVPVGHAPDVHLLTMAAGLGKQSATHKYSHGHALILSGPSGRGGAARLAARGSLRIGAGVVTVGCPLDAIPEHAARLEAVMLRPIHDADALARVLEDGRINALCLGPGMGTGDREAGLLAVALGMPVPGLTRDLGHSGAQGGPGGPGSSPGRGLLLDADALTLLAQHPDLFAALHGACVLTPHAGEFSRLFPDIAAKLAGPATKGPAYSKVDAAREAAARAGCVVLFKGPDTVIADPAGRAAVNSAHYDRAAPWLATAGSGDVLAGFITGLLARGFPPFDAACTGAWLHVECALGFGPGLIAEDLAEELPKVFRALGI
jgi:NAD(P)H-hydrate repair Nnr-like enzyme with NAD(P)H-hydrate dehydratase domain